MITKSILGIIVGISLIVTLGATNLIQHDAEATRVGRARGGVDSILASAPVVVSGDNIYIVWWTNNTENGNEEVMFRASTDGGATFGDRINLSNTTDVDSGRVEIDAEADTVVVSWWETNQTSDIPVARISNDAGETFGPTLRLGANGTIDSTEEEVIATEAGEWGGEGGGFAIVGGQTIFSSEILDTNSWQITVGSAKNEPSVARITTMCLGPSPP